MRIAAGVIEQIFQHEPDPQRVELEFDRRQAALDAVAAGMRRNHVVDQADELDAGERERRVLLIEPFGLEDRRHQGFHVANVGDQLIAGFALVE